MASRTILSRDKAGPGFAWLNHVVSHGSADRSFLAEKTNRSPNEHIEKSILLDFALGTVENCKCETSVDCY